MRVGSLILVASAFGPYLFSSIRTEQLAVYAAFPPALLFGPLVYRRIRNEGWKILFGWGLLIFWAAFGYLWSSPQPMPWSKGNPIASLDNLVLPLAVLVVVWALIPEGAAAEYLRWTATLIVVFCTVNAALALLTPSSPTLTTALRYFWAPMDGTETVAERAGQLGRYSGVFGQPSEAGVAYSVAGVALVHYFAKRPWILLSSLPILIIGAAFSVSKIFLFIGLPVAILYLMYLRSITQRITLIIIAVLTGAVIWSSGLLQSWNGLRYLTRLMQIPAGVGFIEFYTANRWNEGSSMTEVIREVLGASPLTGSGLSGLKVPYDSAWAEAFVLAGTLGAIALSSVFITLYAFAKRMTPDPVGRLGQLLVIVLLASSLGIPSLTANRAATLVWLLLAGVLAQYVDMHHPQDSSGSTQGLPRPL